MVSLLPNFYTTDTTSTDSMGNGPSSLSQHMKLDILSDDSHTMTTPPISPIPNNNQMLQGIIDICTAKDPDHRYQSCDELLTDLEEL